MKKLLFLLAALLLLTACAEKTTVLEVAYIDSYYRVMYTETSYSLGHKMEHTTYEKFYTQYGVDNFFYNNVDVNLSEWPGNGGQNERD